MAGSLRTRRGASPPGPASVPPARSRHRGCLQRTPAAEARSLRRVGVRRAQNGAAAWNAAAHRVRRDARLRRPELRRHRPPRLAAIPCRPSRTLRMHATTAREGARVCVVCADGFRHRPVLAHRVVVGRRGRRARRGDPRRRTQRRRDRANLSVEARSAVAAPRDIAAGRGLQPVDAFRAAQHSRRHQAVPSATSTITSSA